MVLGGPGHRPLVGDRDEVLQLPQGEPGAGTDHAGSLPGNMSNPQVLVRELLLYGRSAASHSGVGSTAADRRRHEERAMPTVTFHHGAGSSDVLDVEDGTSLMRAAVHHGVRGIVGECGGQ